MRLLNTSTLRLEYFMNDAPPYVILSHTWGDGEVTFDDIHEPLATSMPGYVKIANCYSPPTTMPYEKGGICRRKWRRNNRAPDNMVQNNKAPMVTQGRNKKRYQNPAAQR
ncbi:hypothetical protein BCR34DRAFT_590679 [Clohesyomyces aquaticus]|uniref:Heterokaryon incompatibility domain-containing protein n=1 Tax=Clohesyomyces aquaticus TaxID=1231657 RepID=A0A1Y1Z7K7_9PLEO|nr:hypothetical protein BCR34DRAFT_590679 [Clohesyomyces aquaticus]